MFKVVFLFATIACVAHAQLPGTGPCPKINSLANLDGAKFAGKWYVAERYVSFFDSGKCVAHSLVNLVVGNMVTTRTTDPSTNIETTLVGASAQLGAAWPGYMLSIYPTTQIPIPIPFTVINTDYTSYAVTYACIDLGFANTKLAWILTRERNASASALNSAYSVCDGNSVDRKPFVKVDQINCPAGH